MWGGRFAAGPSAVMQEINASIDIDKRLYREDIAGSLAHAAMLAERGIISKEDGAAIARGLEAIRGEIDAGSFTFDPALEDIHTNIEVRLKALIGDAAGRLHRSGDRSHGRAQDALVVAQ